MKRTIALTAIICCAVSSVSAEYAVWEKGIWPESWPRELEPLRKQSRTYEGPIVQLRYIIPFTKREDFESAWPHLLKVKSKGAPLILVVRSPATDFFRANPAGVIIHSPPDFIDKRANPEAPLPGEMDVRTKWTNTTFIELVVDGEIVDLNRIPLPPETPIVDERFKDGQKK